MPTETFKLLMSMPLHGMLLLVMLNLELLMHHVPCRAAVRRAAPRAEALRLQRSAKPSKRTSLSPCLKGPAQPQVSYPFIP